MIRSLPLLLALLFVIGPPVAGAQSPVRVEGEALIRRSGEDLLVQQDLAASPDGTCFLAWSRRDPNDQPMGAFGQYFDRHGNPISGQIVVSDGGIGQQRGITPRVSINAAGEVAVLSTTRGASPYGVLRRISPGGVILNTNRPLTLSPGADVAMGPDRVLVISRLDRTVQFFDFEGEEEIRPALDLEFLADAFAMDAEGNFVTVSRGGELTGRRFDLDGNQLGDPFRIDQSGEVGLFFPDIGMNSSGGFAVAWLSDDLVVRARQFAADGTPAGDEIVVGAAEQVALPKLSVAVGESLAFLVVWSATDRLEPAPEIFGRFVGDDGVLLGDVFRVNENTFGFQGSAVTASGDDGIPWIVWQTTFQGIDLAGQSFHDPCLAGNVGAGPGPGLASQVLTVNGSTGGDDRTVLVPAGDPLEIRLEAAPSRPGGTYVLYGWRAVAPGSCLPIRVGGNLLGQTTYPLPLRPGETPQPLVCVRGDGVPDRACRGVTELPGPSGLPLVLNHPGTSRIDRFAFQAIVRDTAAPATPPGFGISNVVFLEITLP
jgi:hypothetical protein